MNIVNDATNSDGTILHNCRSGVLQGGIFYKYLMCSSGCDWIYADITVEQSMVEAENFMYEISRRIHAYRFMVCSKNKIEFLTVDKANLEHNDLLPLLHYGDKITEMDLRRLYSHTGEHAFDRLRRVEQLSSWDKLPRNASLLTQLILLYDNLKCRTLHNNTPDECIVSYPTCRVGQFPFTETLRHMKENEIAHEIPSPYAHKPGNQENDYYRIDIKAFENNLLKLLRDNIGNSPHTSSIFEHVV